VLRKPKRSEPGPHHFFAMPDGAGPSEPLLQGRAAGSAPPGPRCRGCTAGSGCQDSSRGAVAVEVFCGSGMFCPKKLCKVLCSGMDSPSLKMGTYCRKFAEDVLSKDCFIPRTVLSQGHFITKFLGQKIHRTFRPGMIRQGTYDDSGGSDIACTLKKANFILYSV
jgi:hypothetical protein